MSATQERDQVGRIAGSDFDAALRIARNIDDPWFRCQALAEVAWHATDHGRFLGLVTDSLESGWTIKNPNRAATVIAWPVAALAKRPSRRPGELERNDREVRLVLARLTRAIAEDLSPVSRADALLLHVHALSSSLPERRGEVLALLVKECRDPSNWKRQRQLEEAALVIAPDDPETARDLVASLDEGRRHRAIARIEDQSAGLGPRPFFNVNQTPN